MLPVHPVKQWHVESLEVRVYADKRVLSEAAADEVADVLKRAIKLRGRAVAIFSTGVSQLEFIAALRTRRGIDWEQVVAFHLDEYLGLSPDHPASLRRFLRERLFAAVRPGAIHYMAGEAPDPQAECRRYAKLLTDLGPADIACIGIGENGHIAFNDPHAADFNDPALVKIVDLDEACRRQQAGEGWFSRLEDVPPRALTLTVPAILSAKIISCVTPEARKADAVRRALEGPVTSACPASVLRNHRHAILYLDRESSALLHQRE
ncbi:MAG: glucosamine-6-phosphate deaminase [Candidatus Sumerlaeia bacterium]|nr:glucosamine-6-phosphate deaminase [Candidatus Sumerlaeia bacterium]